MIDVVLDLRRDGNEQPQFFALTVRYSGQGEGYTHTTVFGTEADLRVVLRDGRVAGPAIDTLFRNAR